MSIAKPFNGKLKNLFDHKSKRTSEHQFVEFFNVFLFILIVKGVVFSFKMDGAHIDLVPDRNNNIPLRSRKLDSLNYMIVSYPK